MVIGYIGWTLAFLGLYYMANKKIKGVWICLAADSFLVVDAWHHEHTSLFVACCLFMLMHLYMINKWTIVSEGTKS